MALSSAFEFTNSFSNSKRDLSTLFESTASKLNIRPYTPRHNGKVERSHREDQKRFYFGYSFRWMTLLCSLASITATPTTPP